MRGRKQYQGFNFERRVARERGREAERERGREGAIPGVQFREEGSEGSRDTGME
eukprot:COSAG03_NODE_1784_length_3527_cov_10.765753_4_plen_54_part_00